MQEDLLQEQRKDGGGSIVVVGTNTSNKTRISVDEGMNNDAPPAQTWVPHRQQCEEEEGEGTLAVLAIVVGE
jgi:hypothetical protein